MVITRSQLMQRPPQGLLGHVVHAGKKIVSAINTRRERRHIATLATANPHTIRNAARPERRAVKQAIGFLTKHNPAAVKNWYEGGFPFLDGTASWLPSIIQDARFDQNNVTRREAMRRMRYWSQNSDIFKSVLDTSRQYTIGTHAPIVTSLATSSDPDENGRTWSQRAEIVFHEMIATAGLDGESLFQMLTVAHDCQKVDGDLLFVETSRLADAPPQYPGIKIRRPALQMVEAHRIETPPSRWNEEGKTIIDGVQFKIVDTKLPDGTVRKTIVRVGYWVKDANSIAFGDDSYNLIPVENCTLIFAPTRVNQIRGLSEYIVGEPTLALLEDLLKLEMRAQEVQSDLTTFITNGAGQMVSTQTQGTLSALGIKVARDDAGNAIVTAKQVAQVKEMYQTIFGGRQIVGRTGDTIEHMAPNRPAEATLHLWNFLINSFCVSAKVVRQLAFPKSEKGQGTEVRADLDKFNSACIAEFNLKTKPLMQRVWNFFIGWANKNDPRCADAPADWQHIEVSPPRSVLVDAGYDSAAMLAELASGVTNLHFIAQRLGTTRQKLIELSVSDLVLLKRACNKASGLPDNTKVTVTAEEIRQNLSDVIKNLAAMKTAEAAQKTAAMHQQAA